MGARGEGSVVRRVGAATPTLFRSAALALSLLPKHRRGVRANGFNEPTVSRQKTDTDFLKDDERGVCEKLIRFESFLHPSLSHPSLQ